MFVLLIDGCKVTPKQDNALSESVTLQLIVYDFHNVLKTLKIAMCYIIYRKIIQNWYEILS